MNSDFRPQSHATFSVISAAALLISIPLFFFSNSPLIFLSTAAVLTTTACIIYFTDIFDFKINKTYYPVIAALYFIDIIPILDAFGIHGGYKSEYLNFPQTIEWYATAWMQLLLVVGVLIAGHSMVKWVDRKNCY
ncbi:hypothetical protein [Limnohabitans radicicola]|uniref:Uncharacterized protein n=1 Tax=Limnohabitans radicicola TaxID=2771427 RepID=A0A927IMF2_9BURK|nr:hypothetical protein [Limnohabitans radicicola]MBD8051126.1 hypothetical protein [Limnohabitans radicicola]